MSGNKNHKNGDGVKKDTPQIENEGEEVFEEKTSNAKEPVKGNNKANVSLKPTLVRGIIVLVIILIIATLTVAVIGLNSYLNRPVAAVEITAVGTTVAEETGKITYEEFKESLEELSKNGDTMSNEEFQKKVKELLMKLSTKDLLRAADYIDGQNAGMAIMTTTTETTKSEETAAVKEISETISWGWKTEWYRSPFREVTKQLEDELTWETFAEPGIYPGLDGVQTRWNDFSAEETPMLVPEGGWLYFATGSYKLSLFDSEKNEITDFLFAAPAAKERIYLTIVKGLPADGEDLDLNQIVMATDYVRSAGTYHDMPTAAYVSLDWFEQQIENAREESPGIESPNVGDNGAEEVIVVIIDLETQTVRAWKVVGPNNEWQRVDENYF